MSKSKKIENLPALRENVQKNKQNQIELSMARQKDQIHYPIVHGYSPFVRIDITAIPCTKNAMLKKTG